jgi:hypothetical protein
MAIRGLSDLPHNAEVRRQNEELAAQLLRLTKPATEPELQPAPVGPPQNADVVVSHAEVNAHHGVGVLLLRMFGSAENIVSFRSKDLYGGKQSFGAMNVCLAHGDAPRDTVVWNVLQAMTGGGVQRIVCVPYYPDDVLTAIALKEAFGAPLCTFLMDDQNLCAEGIPDRLMTELLDKSALRLAISPQMCAGYEAKYGHKIWFMPPLAPSRCIPPEVNALPPAALRERQPLILGNIWGQRWVELLRRTIRGTGVQVRWHNNGHFPWLTCTKEDLARDGILPQDGKVQPDEWTVALLREVPFVIVPSGTLDDNDDRRFIAQLSFPSRIPYIAATSHTPILVLGSPETTAAEVVRHFGIGLTSPYEPRQFAAAVERIIDPDVNLAMRRSAFLASNRFSDLGATEWLWQSLAKGEPADDRYENLMRRPDAVPETGRRS